MNKFSILVLLALGCPGSTEPTDSDTDVEVDTGVDTDTSDTGEDTDVIPSGPLTGTVTDEAGDPVVGAMVNYCRDVCVTQSTNASGVFEFPSVDLIQSAFYVIADAGDDLVSIIVPVLLDSEVGNTIDVNMFEAETTVDIPTTATATEIADGLTLTIGEDNLEPAPFTDLPDNMGGLQVSLDDVLPLDLIEGEPIAAWYLEPFEAESEDGLDVVIQNQWGLEEGDTFEVWVSSDALTFEWIDAGDVTVQAGGATLEGDAALSILTTVVLVDPTPEEDTDTDTDS